MRVKSFCNQIRLLLMLSLFYSFHANSDVDVNVKWLRETETIYALSISPRGQVFNPFNEDGRGLTCIRVSEGCSVTWELRINDSYYKTCPTTISVPYGTTIEKLMPQINSRMMVPCTFPAYDFKGNEQLCLRLVAGGDWFSSISTLGTPYVVFVRFGQQSACFQGGGNGQTGELVPPIQLPSCQVSPQSIVLQHPALIASELNNNRKEININVSCNRESSVNLRMTGINGSSRLELAKDGSLSSELTINNLPARKGITINNVGISGESVMVASKLLSNGETPAGNYSASAVLQVTIP
ncbi:MrpH family fimbial adhesin [Serratia ficaria]|uniref:MrpH family fimbial adhesin n=1 Tax=Serratia ficaria TaxID=61651 RepID=UPI0021837BD6|nr:hypothetical protein [Serratia ficaria]CAI2526435.1 Uncharacterised protein [Serratia ficaria]